MVPAQGLCSREEVKDTPAELLRFIGCRWGERMCKKFGDGSDLTREVEMREG